FTVGLPLAPPRSAATGDGGPAAPALGLPVFASLEGLRVLVVDDDPDARQLVSAVLAQCQVEVRTAPGAAAGLVALAAWRPDVLISDIGMPDVDGYDFIRQVRALTVECGGSVPAVALTAYAGAEDRVRALAAGFQAHAPKPIEPAEIVALVASLTGRLIAAV
ncbi:MAG TPA: response regulator, partial [Blastocatellia bacterium]|nr:response regulator [Blastocatellia bacterium]